MPGKRLASEIEASLAFVHRANIQRYKHLLKSELTNDERALIVSRIAEEESALHRLGNETF